MWGPSGEVPVSFIQIIEMVTTRPDDVEALVDEWGASTDGTRTVSRGTFTQDRDGPNIYI